MYLANKIIEIYNDCKQIDVVFILFIVIYSLQLLIIYVVNLDL